jgi:ATP-dependent Lhr-like helicase
VGNGKRQVFFAFDQDINLAQADQSTEQSIEAPVKKWFPNPFGHYDFSTLLELSDYSPEQLSDQLWEAVWQGVISNDTFAALRRGIETQFKFSKDTSPKTGLQGRRHRTGHRISFSRWQASLPSIGKWFLLPTNVSNEDLIEIEEQVKDRVRVLLDRYGILFRELLKKELRAFQWGSIFRALRLMELSGEVLAGYFFRDIPGPQFISHHAFRILQQKIPNDRVYWLNATDPASLCGAQLKSLKQVLPKRVNSTHLVYHGTRLVAISQRNGHILTFNVTPEDPDLPLYFGFLNHLLNRKSRPLRRIIIDTINGEDAIQSPYLDSFRTTFDVLVDYRNVTLYRRSS